MQGKQTRQQISGSHTERSAEALLQGHGLKTLARNYRCKAGEIDLIMLDQDYLVFVEVRLRSNSDYVSALESVDRRKQNKLIRSAQLFLQQNPHYGQHFCRFDVVASEHSAANAQELVWIKDAFQN